MTSKKNFQVGETVFVNPSAYGWDSYRGNGQVTEIQNDGEEICVSLFSEEIWFNSCRISKAAQ